MNAKTAKTIRKYCKQYGKNYKDYKKAYLKSSPEDQLKVLYHMRGAIYGKKKNNN
jgi:ubiquitin